MARILVIDDEPALRELLQKALTSAGYEAILAEDGDEGLRLFIQAPADLVIVDLYMAGRDGMEIISDLRKRSPRLPLIAISGRYLADELLGVTKLLGVKATFKKPFVLAQLLVSVEEALSHER